MPHRNIRTPPRVRAGRQFLAERSVPAVRDHNIPGDAPRVFRKNPGPGHRHVLMVRPVRAFIAILPDWPTLSVGLNAIGLVPPTRPGVDGFHRAGLVAVCSTPRDLCPVVDNPAYITTHQRLFDRLGVPVEPAPGGQMIRFTERTLRAFQLLHVLLHELGHHHDRMTTRSRRRPSRGESYAERYAVDYGDRIWDRYFDAFPERLCRVGVLAPRPHERPRDRIAWASTPTLQVHRFSTLRLIVVTGRSRAPAPSAAS